MKTQLISNYSAIVGIDWADTKHDFCIQSPTADASEKSLGVIPHDPAVIDEWIIDLHQRFGGRLAIALELASGPIVSVLQKYDFIDIFPTTPSLSLIHI